MYYVLTQAFGMGVFFTYIASSPFILQQHYGLSPIGYSVCFATNAAGIIVGSWLAGRFRRGSNALSAGLWGLVGSGVLCATTRRACPRAGVVATGRAGVRDDGLRRVGDVRLQYRAVAYVGQSAWDRGYDE